MDNFQDVFKNVFANTPETIVPKTIMKKPNETIDVYNDEFNSTLTKFELVL
jgi:hypothetical protein